MTINIYVFCEATSCILVAGFFEMFVRSYQDTRCYGTLHLADESITYPVVLVHFCGYYFFFSKKKREWHKNCVSLSSTPSLFRVFFLLINVQRGHPQIPGARSPG